MTKKKYFCPACNNIDYMGVTDLKHNIGCPPKLTQLAEIEHKHKIYGKAWDNHLKNIKAKRRLLKHN